MDPTRDEPWQILMTRISGSDGSDRMRDVAILIPIVATADTEGYTLAPLYFQAHMLHIQMVKHRSSVGTLKDLL